MTLMALTPDWLALPGFPDADPVAGLAGGLMIGLASAIVLLGFGRIAGITDITARALGFGQVGMPQAKAWAFLAGLPLGAGLVWLATGLGKGAVPAWPWLLGAGLIVGFGTRMASGCTSGHGVCGISRLSARSIVATVTFIGAGMATVAAMRALGVAG